MKESHALPLVDAVVVGDEAEAVSAASLAATEDDSCGRRTQKFMREYTLSQRLYSGYG